MGAGYEALKTYGWHDPNWEEEQDGAGCLHWYDDIPTTPKGWERLPKKCACGFYQALRRLREEGV